MLPGLMFCLGSTELEFSTLKISWSDVLFEFSMQPVLAVGLADVRCLLASAGGFSQP